MSREFIGVESKKVREGVKDEIESGSGENRKQRIERERGRRREMR